MHALCFLPKDDELPMNFELPNIFLAHFETSRKPRAKFRELRKAEVELRRKPQPDE
jgi:hypothetical protein